LTRQVLDQLLGGRRPDYAAAVSRGAWLSLARAAATRDEVARIERDYPLARALLDPHAYAAVVKADATIATVADHGALMTTAIGAYLASLAPISAAAKLIEAGQRVTLTPRSTISFPRLATAPAPVAWVGEATPIPAGSLDFDADTLGPHRKVGVLLVVSRELLKRSAGFAVIDQALRERAGATIDAAIFSAEAGDDTIHRGLLADATPVSPSGDPGRDVEALIGGVGDAGGTGAAMLACNPREAATIRVRLPQLPYQILETRALAAGTLAAVDPASFVSTIGEIDISAGESAVIHMEDTTPLEIVSGTGPTTADPVRSTFQTATIALAPAHRHRVHLARQPRREDGGRVVDLTTDSTEDDRRARVLARAAEILLRAEEATAKPRPDRAQSDIAWQELERGRRAREQEREWAESLERIRAPAPPPPPPAPGGPFLTIVEANARHDALMTAIGEVFRREREGWKGNEGWKERIAAFEIRLAALEAGARNAAE
jgi:hypothetical protein